jgi:hypothetical protein
MTNEYDLQAETFLKNTNTTFTARLIGTYDHFGDGVERDVYEVTLRNPKGSYTFKFGDSIDRTTKRLGTYKPHFFRGSVYDLQRIQRREKAKHKSIKAYDVLSCLTKYDPGSFMDFCSEFDYGTDSRKALKTYLAVQEEYHNVARLFTEDEMEKLEEIQ